MSNERRKEIAQSWIETITTQQWTPFELGLPLGRAGYKRKALSTSFSVALFTQAEHKLRNQKTEKICWRTTNYGRLVQKRLQIFVQDFSHRRRGRWEDVFDQKIYQRIFRREHHFDSRRRLGFKDFEHSRRQSETSVLGHGRARKIPLDHTELL